MEHLLDTNDRAGLRIRYYGGCGGLPYDGKGSNGYLARHGYNEKRFMHEIQRPLADAEYRHLLCLLQNYTFYAVLDDVHHEFGRPFVIERFVNRDQDGIAWVTTARLRYLARHIALVVAEHIVQANHTSNSLFDMSALNHAPNGLLVLLAELDRSSRSDPQFAASTRRLQVCFENIKGFLSRVAVALEQAHGLLLDNADYQIVLASRVLIHSIEHLLHPLVGMPKGETTLSKIDGTAFRTRMLENGWCPNRLSGLVPDVSLAAYMTTLDPGMPRLHGIDSPATSRNLNPAGKDDVRGSMNIRKEALNEEDANALPSCSATVCFKSIVQRQNVRPQHRCSAEASCSELYVDQDLLCSMYSTTSFPVIAVSSSDEQPLPKRCQRPTLCPTFVAFSHVGTHGLGNSSANSLPRCQISFLAGLAKKVLPESPLFWIDTLCVPVSTTHAEHRKVATSRLKDIYGSAYYTIILDGNLQQVEDNPHEMGLQLLCSEWGRRLWTFSEAVLPNPCWLLVQFKDKLLLWNSVCNTREKERRKMVKWISQRTKKDRSKSPEMDRLAQKLMDRAFARESPFHREIPPSQIWNPMEAYIRYQLDEMIKPAVAHAWQRQSSSRVAQTIYRRSTTDT